MYHLITEYVTACLWERGGRERNEDALTVICIRTANKPVLLAAVADGVGGLSHGDAAASYIISEIRKSFIRYTQDTVSPNSDNLKHIFLRTLYSCHRHIREHDFITDKGQSGPDTTAKSASTVSLICLIGNKGIYIHSGDSRLYKINRAFMRPSGSLHPAGKDHIDSKGRLLRCIGTGAYHKPEIMRIRVKKGRALLLCTDGFYKKSDELSLTKLAYHASEEDLTALLKKISDENKRQGERDNQSAVVIKLRDNQKTAKKIMPDIRKNKGGSL